MQHSIWPPILYLALTLLAFGYTIAKHGQPKEGKYDAIASLIAVAVIITLLHWGHFFDPLLNR